MAETTNLWDKFDNSIDTAALQNEVKEAAENGSGNYKEVPVGKYEVSVEKMELVQSKKGDPMVTIWFKVVGKDDPYKGSLIFFNQVINQGFQIHIVNELLRAMDTGMDIQFVTYKQYGNLLMDTRKLNLHLIIRRTAKDSMCLLLKKCLTLNNQFSQRGTHFPFVK